MFENLKHKITQEAKSEAQKIITEAENQARQIIIEAEAKAITAKEKEREAEKHNFHPTTGF